MNAHQILRIPMWLALLSALVLSVGGNMGGGAFGLVQGEGESVGAYDVSDDGSSDPSAIPSIHLDEPLNAIASCEDAAKDGGVPAQHFSFNAHLPTGPPGRIAT